MSRVKIRIAIAVSEFNSGITFKMLDVARAQADRLKLEIKYVCYVPGTFDMPLFINELLKKQNIDAVVALGAVIKGETRHDDIVAENAARIIADLSVKYGKPVALGIIGPGATIDQAKERAELVPIRAVNAAVNIVTRIKKLKEQKSKPSRTVIISN